MRGWHAVLIGLAGLAFSGAAVQAQEYGYYRYFGPGPYAYAPPPPVYFVPPPPPRHVPPRYGYVEPYWEYEDEYAPPPPPRYRVQPDYRGQRDYQVQPYYRGQPDYFAPPPARERAPAASATQRAPMKTASAPQKPVAVSCNKAGEIVSGYGFGNVKPVTCEGKIFGFSALRDGKTYRVQVSAATGEITEVRKQP